jgi:hypothetical protein
MSYAPHKAEFLQSEKDDHVEVTFTSQPEGGIANVTSASVRRGGVDLLFDRADGIWCTGQFIPLDGVSLLRDKGLVVVYQSSDGKPARRATFPIWAWGDPNVLASAQFADISSVSDRRYGSTASPLEDHVRRMPEPLSRWLNRSIWEKHEWVRNGRSLVLPPGPCVILSYDEVRLDDNGDMVAMSMGPSSFLLDRYFGDRAVSNLLMERGWRSWAGLLSGPIPSLGYPGFQHWESLRKAIDRIHAWHDWLESDDGVSETFSTGWRIKRGMHGPEAMLVLQRSSDDGWRTADIDGKVYGPSSWADVQADLGEHLKWGESHRGLWMPYPLAIVVDRTGNSMGEALSVLRGIASSPLRAQGSATA